MLDPINLCQIEISVKDVNLSLSFYEEVFSWREVPCDIFQYHILDVPKKSPFGIALIPSHCEVKKQSKTMTLYFHHEDPARIIERAKEFYKSRSMVHTFGKTRLVPGYGQVSYVEDPDSHPFGLFVRAHRKS